MANVSARKIFLRAAGAVIAASRAALPAAVRQALKPMARPLLLRIGLMPKRPDRVGAIFGRLMSQQGGFTPLTRRAVANAGPRVLVATSIGGYNHGVTIDSLLGAALTLRDARIEFLLCDSVLPACMKLRVTNSDLGSLPAESRPEPCIECVGDGRRAYEPLGLPTTRMSQLIDPGTRAAIAARVAASSIEELKTMVDGGVAIGEHAVAGALRYFARGDFDGEETAVPVLRRYVEAALFTATAVNRLLDQGRYDAAVIHHGIYVPQGIVAEVCRSRGVRVITWNPAYRKQCVVFSHHDTYHRTMVSEATDRWETLPWNRQLEKQILDYLQSRWHGAGDWIWFHTTPNHDREAVQSEVGIRFDRPLVTLLSNVMWDAQIHYSSNTFPSMLDWVLKTIAYFAKRPDVQLVIRIHPAEINGFVPSRQRLAGEIAKVFPQLPPNVFIVPPESHASTYTLCDHSDAVIIYNTKTGMEVTAQGIPTIVAGEAWIRDKGFCFSPKNPEEYISILDELPFGQRMSPEQRRRAQMYAYHVFFRRMIPLEFLTGEMNGDFSVKLDAMDDLAPGRYPGLDVICDGILKGTPFVFPAETLAPTLSAGEPEMPVEAGTAVA